MANASLRIRLLPRACTVEVCGDDVAARRALVDRFVRETAPMLAGRRWQTGTRRWVLGMHAVCWLRRWRAAVGGVTVEWEEEEEHAG